MQLHGKEWRRLCKKVLKRADPVAYAVIECSFVGKLVTLLVSSNIETPEADLALVFDIYNSVGVAERVVVWKDIWWTLRGESDGCDQHSRKSQHRLELSKIPARVARVYTELLPMEY